MGKRFLNSIKRIVRTLTYGVKPDHVEVFLIILTFLVLFAILLLPVLMNSPGN